VQELLDAVKRGSENPEPPPLRDRRPPLPGPDDAPLVSLAESLLRARAREAGLAYELLAARADLQAIVTSRREEGEEADVRTLRGWRRELVGEELLRLLDGGVSLSVRNTADGRRLSVEGPRPGG
jgi:ribonuclease D